MQHRFTAMSQNHRSTYQSKATCAKYPASDDCRDSMCLRFATLALLLASPGGGIVRGFEYEWLIIATHGLYKQRFTPTLAVHTVVRVKHYDIGKGNMKG